MERRYREVTLKRKKHNARIAFAGLVFLVLLLLTLGASEGWKGALIRWGTNYVSPAIFSYQESRLRSRTLYLSFLVPDILVYAAERNPQIVVRLESEKLRAECGSNQDGTESGEPAAEPAFGEGVVNTESASREIFLALSEDTELWLLQENIYGSYEAPAAGSIPVDGSPIVDTGTFQEVRGFDLNAYHNMTDLIKEFYIVDASTSPDANLLDVDKLTAYDCRIDQSAPGPQILIYHSHSQEGFADSVPGDKSTTIVGAGERLTGLLEQEYGYEVLHHTGVYDLPTRDVAYSNALPDIERVLEENPTIQVVIDLHRDAVAEETKLVTTIDGKDYARFMFFNGLCRSQNGAITYLNNPYLQENLAFSFQSQVVAESYFPGITRKIYLKAWRYNMHFRPRNMLIELGAQTNTVEEVMNTCDILAFVIDKVLSGQ